MNYEELIATRDQRKSNKVRIPFGFFHKRLIDGKYTNFLEFHDELTDGLAFASCVKREHEIAERISSKHQLHYTLGEGADGVYALAIEPGNYQTMEQLLNEEPSVVARRDFITNTIQGLVEVTTQLNEAEVRHECFAPCNIFVRKNNHSVALLCHGSCYARLGMNDVLYEGIEEYVAPEVLRGEESTDRSDVYSLARFIDYLYASSGLPFELKGVLQRATNDDPQQRYANVGELWKTIQQRSQLRRTATVAGAALLAALVVVWLFFELLPSTDPVEFVKPVEDPITDEMIDEGFDPSTELGAAADSASIARALKDFQVDSTRIDDRKLREFEAKGEQIFRKQYAKEAERILSKIYNNDRLNDNQKNFQAASEDVMKELTQKQHEMAAHSSLSEEKSQRIAAEIIEQVSNKKKAELEKKPNYQFQNGKGEE